MRGLEPSASTPRLVVIGNFDGVHRGHQAVLRTASKLSSELGLRPTVLTFDPHPAAVLGRGVRAALTPTSRKKALLKEVVTGLDVEVQHFTRELAGLSPEDFARTILKEKLNARRIFVGENFRFGKSRSGDLSSLKSLGEALGFSAQALPLEGDSEGPFSSTRIRNLLEEGDVEGAAGLLSRPHRLTGLVVQGDQRGRELGFPTANLERVEEALPCEGVYATRVLDAESGEYLGGGALNLGARPTVDRPKSVEVHILDFSAEIYGKRLALDLHSRIRGVQKFANLAELKSQIAADVETARLRLVET